jgi:hypothetical protein
MIPRGPEEEAHSVHVADGQLAGRAIRRGTEERTPTRMVIFWPGKNILKSMMFRDVTTVLNERTHLKMVVRSVPDPVSLILDRAE